MGRVMDASELYAAVLAFDNMQNKTGKEPLSG
jgi:hypothetical protein